jgi:FkbM family methyltransferase
LSKFISYAQNFEDLMLWRALRDVAQGFYIDVGAADPDEDSVTRAFYDRGWRGINVEPTPDYFEALEAARPRDINLPCLVGAVAGEAELNYVVDTGLSTMNPEFASRHIEAGHVTRKICLPMRTLAEICRDHAPADIHFLKIDVEGAEGEVLRGADFAAFRPWIVIVEATEPVSQVENWQAWQDFLTDAQYRFVWFDGLNRFYLAVERWDSLPHAFTTPPNVFDEWVQPRGRQQRALAERGQSLAVAAIDEINAAHAAIAAAHKLLAAAEADARESRAKIAVAEADAAEARAHRAAIEAELRPEVARLSAALAEALETIARAEPWVVRQYREWSRRRKNRS